MTGTRDWGLGTGVESEETPGDSSSYSVIPSEPKAGRPRSGQRRNPTFPGGGAPLSGRGRFLTCPLLAGTRGPEGPTLGMTRERSERPEGSFVSPSPESPVPSPQSLVPSP